MSNAVRDPDDMMLTTVTLKDWARQRGRLPRVCREILRLRDVLRGLHKDACETEDARDFTLGVQAQLKAEVESWGEEAYETEEARRAREEAELEAKERAEFARLQAKYGGE